MGQNAPRYQLEKLPPLREKVETIEILRQTNKSTAALAELKPKGGVSITEMGGQYHRNIQGLQRQFLTKQC